MPVIDSGQCGGGLAGEREMSEYWARDGTKDGILLAVSSRGTQLHPETISAISGHTELLRSPHRRPLQFALLSSSSTSISSEPNG